MLRPLLTALVVAFIAFGLATPFAHAAPGNACSLLAPAQIKSAIGADVSAGNVASAKLCSWSPSVPASSDVKSITLLLQSDTSAFEAGKHMPAPAVVTSVSGVGDDAFFLAVGDQVGLIVKKGSVVFKVAVYARVPLEKKEAMEKSLATLIVPHL